MSKADLNDICGRFLSARLSKPNGSSFSKTSLTSEHIASEHKCHTILTQKLLFKPYKKNPLDQLRKRYSNIGMPDSTDVVVPTFPSTSLANKNPSTTSPTTTTNNNKCSLMMNWQLLKDRGSGLINLGNTCFINASLQCLANTPPLVQWLMSNSHHQYCRMKLEKKICLFCEAERIVKLIHTKNSFSSSIGPANPNNIVRRIKEISKTFRFGRQEDASEFLICLIDKIVEACLRSSQPPERLRPSSGSSYDQLCHSQTFLHDLFALVLRSRVICSRCRHTSDTFEVQYTWIVGVRNHSDLRQSLQQFVCRETLAGENLYRCMKCKQLVPAVKRYTLHKASKILLINFKRFEFGKNSHKLSHLVRYPESLNVKPFMSEENTNDHSLNYRLYAVLVHVGSSMHSGHYYSYVRSPNNRWYKADDTTMTQCDLTQVLTQHGAYILCYIKETEPSSVGNGSSNGVTTTAVSQLNGKGNHGEAMTNSKFFIPRPLPVQNLPRQINGYTKPSLAHTNGNGISSSKQREPLVMRLPNPSYLPTKSTDSPSEVVPKSVLLSSTATSNSCTPSSLSSVQSSSSPLKLIIKTTPSPSTLNGHTYHENEDDHLSEVQQPAKKKQRVEDSSSLVPFSQSNSIDEQSVPSFSLKKKKKKSHHQEHNRNRSRSPISFRTDKKKSHLHSRPFSSTTVRESL